MDLVNRLKLYMERSGIAISTFADTCRIPRPTMSQILNGRNKKISDELIGKIHNAYPDLSVLWLMFGEGEMSSNANTQFSEPENRRQTMSNSPAAANNEPLIEPVDAKSGENGFASEKLSALITKSPSAQSTYIPKSVQPDNGNSLINFETRISEQTDIHGNDFSKMTADSNNGIDDFFASVPLSEEHTERQDVIENENSDQKNADLENVSAASCGRKITNIVVFYSDNSFQSFYPGAI